MLWRFNWVARFLIIGGLLLFPFFPLFGMSEINLVYRILWFVLLRLWCLFIGLLNRLTHCKKVLCGIMWMSFCFCIGWGFKVFRERLLGLFRLISVYLVLVGLRLTLMVWRLGLLVLFFTSCSFVKGCFAILLGVKFAFVVELLAIIYALKTAQRFGIILGLRWFFFCC